MFVECDGHLSTVRRILSWRLYWSIKIMCLMYNKMSNTHSHTHTTLTYKTALTINENLNGRLGWALDWIYQMTNWDRDCNKMDDKSTFTKNEKKKQLNHTPLIYTQAMIPIPLAIINETILCGDKTSTFYRCHKFGIKKRHEIESDEKKT